MVVRHHRAGAARSPISTRPKQDCILREDLSSKACMAFSPIVFQKAGGRCCSIVGCANWGFVAKIGLGNGGNGADKMPATIPKTCLKNAESSPHRHERSAAIEVIDIEPHLMEEKWALTPSSPQPHASPFGVRSSSPSARICCVAAHAQCERRWSSVSLFHAAERPGVWHGFRLGDRPLLIRVTSG